MRENRGKYDEKQQKSIYSYRSNFSRAGCDRVYRYALGKKWGRPQQDFCDYSGFRQQPLGGV
jgi:hypothetical protein